jgi:hypothetical protein
MEIKGWSDADLAKEINEAGGQASIALVGQVRRGEKRFGNDNIFAVQKASEGKVTFEDLYVSTADMKASGG